MDEPIPIGDSLEAVKDDGSPVIRCTRCGHVYGLAVENHKLSARLERTPVTAVPGVGDPARYGLDTELELRRYYCPGCAVQIEAELSHPEEPVLRDTELTL